METIGLILILLFLIGSVSGLISLLVIEIHRRVYFRRKIKPYIEDGATIVWYAAPKSNPFKEDFLNTLKIIEVQGNYARCLKNDCIKRVYSFDEIRTECIRLFSLNFRCRVIPPHNKHENEMMRAESKKYPNVYQIYGLPETIGGCISTYDESELHTTSVTVPTDMVEAINAYAKLITMRNAWWRKLNYTPKWGGLTKNYFIATYNNTIVGNESSSSNHAFAFPNKEVRDAFMVNFKEELEVAKKLIQ